jgi:hypothetical protein
MRIGASRQCWYLKGLMLGTPKVQSHQLTSDPASPLMARNGR